MKSVTGAHPTWVEISRSALLHNVRFLAKRAGRAALIAVVKGNAYGHGMIPVAQLLSREPVWGFGVASVDEALALRRAGIRNPILVLSYPLPVTGPIDAVKRRISLVIHDENSLKHIAQAAHKSGTRARVHLKVNIGTTRIGVAPSAAQRFVRRICALPALQLEGIFSHFADAENADSTYTRLQLRRFQSVLRSADLPKTILRHVACSAALLRYPESRFDAVRVGIALYGVWPSAATRRSSETPQALVPVLSWKTRVLQAQHVPRGTFVGYARGFRTRRSSVIATIPVGYADGYDRSLSKRGVVSIRGKRAPVRGFVCMNMTMVDATDIPGVRVGDEVILLGRGLGREMTITAADLARAAGTIPYEITTRIHPALPRIIV